MSAWPSTDHGDLPSDHSRMVFPDGRRRVVPINAPNLPVRLGERTERTPLWRDAIDMATEAWGAPQRGMPGAQREARRKQAEPDQVNESGHRALAIVSGVILLGFIGWAVLTLFPVVRALVFGASQ